VKGCDLWVVHCSRWCSQLWLPEEHVTVSHIKRCWLDNLQLAGFSVDLCYPSVCSTFVALSTGFSDAPTAVCQHKT